MDNIFKEQYKCFNEKLEELSKLVTAKRTLSKPEKKAPPPLKFIRDGLQEASASFEKAAISSHTKKEEIVNMVNNSFELSIKIKKCIEEVSPLIGAVPADMRADLKSKLDLLEEEAKFLDSRRDCNYDAGGEEDAGEEEDGGQPIIQRRRI